MLPDSGERLSFETGAVRDASIGKGKPSLFPCKALLRVAKRFEAGATKYEKRNWEKGISTENYIDSCFRHLLADMSGDTTEDHLAAAAWNILCLMETREWIKDGSLPKSLETMPRTS